MGQGDLDEALKSHQDSLAITDRLAQTDPTNTDGSSDLAVSYYKVGYVLKAQGKLAKAMKAYQDGLAIPPA